jgi:hypothetical protein
MVKPNLELLDLSTLHTLETRVTHPSEWRNFHRIRRLSILAKDLGESGQRR